MNLQETHRLRKMREIVEAGRTAEIDTQFGPVHVRPSKFAKITKKYCAELIDPDGKPSNTGYFYSESPIAAFYGLGEKLKAAEEAVRAAKVIAFPAKDPIHAEHDLSDKAA